MTEELSYSADRDTVQYKCNGTENALHGCKTDSCSIRGACTVSVRVTCHSAVRLNGYQTLSGRKRVEVFRENSNGDLEWKGLCRDSWTQENTDVVCKQYGFRTGKSKAGGIQNSSKEMWDGIDFNCSGVEDHLSYCHTVRGDRSCDSDVIVTCSNPRRYNETCSEKAPCEDGLSCTKEICKCGNEMKSYWSSEKKKCLYESSVGGRCRSDDDCISDLICQGTGNRHCKCGTGGKFWYSKENKCQQKSHYSAVFVLTPQTFGSARDFCEDEGGHLASPDQIIQLFSSCVGPNKTIWIEGTTEDEMCPIGRNSDGTLLIGNQTSCSNIFSFLCVLTNETLDGMATKCRHLHHHQTIKGADLTNPLSWPIFAGAAFVLILALTIAVLCYMYKRKKRSRPKHRHTASYDYHQSASSGVELNVVKSDAVHGTNGSECYDLAHVSQATTTDLYGNGELGEKPPAVATDLHCYGELGEKPPAVATDLYGYGVLGGKCHNNDGLYSHSKGLDNTGEYDSFIKKDEDTDVNDIYDHTRHQENHYDDFQKGRKC
ncbi:uncharacterized protein [Argopecten irradians]